MNEVQESERIEKYYKFQSKIYDATRWSFLFGRKTLIKKLNKFIEPGMRLIELGCGTGHNLKLLENRKDIEITGLDLSNQMLEIASKKLERTKLLNMEYNIETFAPESFDVILMSYFVTLNSDKTPIMDAVEKHLSKGGIIALVDFHKANLDSYNKFMLKKHIHIDPGLLKISKEKFTTKFTKIRSGYFNIWDWMLYIGEKN